MSDPINTSNVEQQIFTKEQVDALIEAVTKRVRETQAEEAEQRNKGFEIPVEICEELDSYNTFELQKALQKFKRSVPKYNNEDWNTLESTNPNFIPSLNKETSILYSSYLPSINIQKIRELKQEQHQRFLKASNISLKEECNKKTKSFTTPRWKKHADLPFLDLEQLDNRKMRQKKQRQNLSDCHTALNIWRRQKAERKNMRLAMSSSNNTTRKPLNKKSQVKLPVPTDLTTIQLEDEVVDSEAMDIEEEDLF